MTDSQLIALMATILYPHAIDWTEDSTEGALERAVEIAREIFEEVMEGG